MELKNLTMLDISRNPLESLPPEIAEIARGELVEIIRKRAGDNNPFTSEAMIILAERYNSPRKLLEGCAEVCIYSGSC